MLTGLEIYRFRGIRELKLNGLAQVNVLMGRNNAGKSSVLEALYLASAAFCYEDPLGRGNKIEYLLNRRGKRKLSWERGKEALWFGYDNSEDIKLTLRIGRHKLDIELRDDHEHPVVGLSLRGTYPLCPLCLRGYNKMTGTWISIKSVELESKINEVAPGLRDFIRDTVFLDTALLRDIKLIEEALWSRLLMKRLDKLVVDILRSGYDTDVEDLTYAPLYGTYQLMAKLPETAIRVDDLGDGARYALVIIMVAALARDTALLIEEPESHQHPGGLAKMLEMLLALAKENGTQLFMSTHSIEAARLTSAIASELGLDVATFFLERSPDGLVDARRVSPEESELLRAMGLDPRFLDIL